MARGEAKPKEAGNGGGSAEHLLALRDFSKSFGPVRALHEVDFEVDSGEIVALVGDNGAGKSTLIKAIDGVQPPDSGQAYFDGRPVSISGPRTAERLGIATVFQDLALCDNLDVVSNLFLGREVAGSGKKRFPRIRQLFARIHAPRFLKRIPRPGILGRIHPLTTLKGILPNGTLNETEMEERSRELLDDLSVTTLGSVRTEVGSLSGGQRQSVAIARTMIGEPKVVLFDEPTAALGVQQTAQVLALVRRLADDGLGVVMISHNLEDVFQVADRIIVLRLGERVATFDRRQTTPEQVVGSITGADTAEMRRLQEESDSKDKGG
jgi:D-xylose transport system ATP-binding protein